MQTSKFEAINLSLSSSGLTKISGYPWPIKLGRLMASIHQRARVFVKIYMYHALWKGDLKHLQNVSIQVSLHSSRRLTWAEAFWEISAYQKNILPPELLNCLTLSQTTNFRLFQTETVCRRQFQIWRKWQKVIQTGTKHYGKRRNCSLRAISPFPTVFSNGLFPRGVKRCHYVGMG